MDQLPADGYARAKQLVAAGDLAGAEALLRAGAAAGHLPSSFRLAELLLAAGDGARQDEGRTRLVAAAEAGHAQACYLLGLRHAHGDGGFARDLAAARRWCAAAARAGLPAAQFNLGLLLAAGEGGEVDPIAAAGWLRRAALNGQGEAEGCLDAMDRDGLRPRTWDEADTRASVALARTDADGRKAMRFAEYYVDPAIDLIASRFALRRDEIEDAVQQFFLELEEPLERGELRGRPRKESIRHHYDPARGAFRPYLGRALVNFVRNWLRDRERVPGDPPAAGAEEEGAALVEAHAGEWRALLAAFAADTAGRRADAARAVEALRLVLADGLAQADLAARFALSERTMRTAVGLGADLLREWCQASLRAHGDEALAEGVELLPMWLRHPSAAKRARALLLLALVWRRVGA